MNKIIPITGFCNVPDNVSDEDFNEWLQTEIMQEGEISLSNPLAGIDRTDILKHIRIDD